MDGLLLGSGGWIPTSRRETCCLYLRDGDQVILVDAGTGVQRLVEQPELLAGAERLDVVLTHFHLDHVVGLSYLPALPMRAVVWGPGQVLVGRATREVLGRLLGSPMFALTPENVAAGVEEIPPEPWEIGGLTISSRIQRLHSDPTLALRIGDDLTYCTDTAADEGNVDFAAGSRVLLHEAWHASPETDDQIHTAAGEAGRIAREAHVARLVLIHVNPLQKSDQELERPAREEFPEVRAGQDLTPLSLA
jgi:ribonuclease BN (tRNA processing enzyme)